MSASEALKALRLQPVVYADGDFKFRDGFSEESLRPLLDALPQIVALVEACEKGMYVSRNESGIQISDQWGNARAFVMIALRDLREALKTDDLGAADHPALPARQTAAPRDTPINRGTS